MITSLTAHVTRIAVGDCRDGILFFSYQEVTSNGSFFFILSFYFILESFVFSKFPRFYRTIFLQNEKKKPLIIRTKQEWQKAFKSHWLVRYMLFLS